MIFPDIPSIDHIPRDKKCHERGSTLKETALNHETQKSKLFYCRTLSRHTNLRFWLVSMYVHTVHTLLISERHFC